MLCLARNKSGLFLSAWGVGLNISYRFWRQDAFVSGVAKKKRNANV